MGVRKERRVGPNEKERPLKEALPTYLRKRNHTQKKGRGSVIHKPRLLAPRWTLFLFLSGTEGVWNRAEGGRQGTGKADEGFSRALRAPG